MRSLAAALLLSSLVFPVFGAGPLSNRRAPGFALPDVNVNYHDLADYRGKIVIVDIVQTQCPVCGSSHRIFETIRQKFPDKVQILSVVVPPDNQNTVRQFISAFNVKTPVLFDCGQMIGSYLKLTPQKPQATFPHIFIVDGNGWIRSDYEYNGQNASYFESLDPLLNEITGMVKELQGGGSKPAAAPVAAPKAPAKK
jgi:peroxiredoxin